MSKAFTLLSLLFIGLTVSLTADNFPIDFESGTVAIEDFDGGASSVINNPQPSGINTSVKVAQLMKGTGEIWAGSKILRTNTISFSTNQVFSMKVYSPRVGANIIFKLEKDGDHTVADERFFITTVANQWETLTYDFSGSTSDLYTHITFIIDNGTPGDGGADWTFLIDDIEFTPSPLPALTLPIDFEGGPYGFIDFDGGSATVIANPQSSGENTSATVAKIVRDGGATWSGSKLILHEPIDFSAGATFSMKVFSTRADVPILFKLEGPDVDQVSTNTTVANAWETLTWDFTGKTSGNHNTLVFMFDLGTVGDSSANSTFLFDDVELVDNTGGLSQIDLPVTFDDETMNYDMIDFDGGQTELVADPVDASNSVAKTIRETGSAPWAGTTIGTPVGFASRIPFTADKTILSVRVYSPATGIPVLLKAEDHKDNTKTAETITSTTVANAWETLFFDFSNVAPGTNPFDVNTYFDKLSIMFNKGNDPSGDMYFWDDVMFENSTPVFSVENMNMKVYGNQGVLNIRSNGDVLNGTVQVYELSGKVIYQGQIMSNYEQININLNGVYMVRIMDANQTSVQSHKVLIK